MAIDRNAIINEAQKFAAKGQFDKAITEWKRIAKESPDDANVFNTIGDLCLKKNSKPEAVDAYQKAADILANDGFTSKAIALYKKVLNIDPKKIETHLALGDLNAEKGLTGNALESYKIVADHYTRNNETRKALEIFRKMADLNASNVAFRLKLAEMYVKEGMKPEAVAAYLQAADVHVAKSAFKDARQIFEKALALDPNNKDVYHKAGLVYFKEGKFVEACKALKPAFESDPGNSELADLYLDALSKAGRPDEAEAAYCRLVEAYPDRVELREKLYRLYLDRNEHGKAFLEASALANIRIENKDLDGAEEILKAYLAEAPGSVDGMRALSALYNTIGKPAEAAAMLVSAVRVLMDNGDTDGAQKLLARAIELDPEQGEARQLMNTIQPSEAPDSMSERAEWNEAPAESIPEEIVPEPGLEEFSVPSVPEPEEITPEPGLEEFSVPSVPEPEETPILSSPPPLSAPDEDPAVANALAEIDVLLKYGLATKALEQLEGIAKKFPDSIQVRVKLRDIYGDNGNAGKAVSHMRVLADIYMKRGLLAEAEDVLEMANRMDPDNAGAGTGTVEPGSYSGAAAPGESLFSGSSGNEPDDLDLEHQTPADDLSFPGPAEPVLEEAGAPPDSGEILLDHSFNPPDLPPDQLIPDEIPEMEFERGAGRTFEQPMPSSPSEPAAAEEDLSEIWAEAEFYSQQGLFDEARKHYEKIMRLNPDDNAARERLAELNKDQEEALEFSRLAEAVDGLEGLDGADYTGPEFSSQENMSVSESDEEAVRSLMQEIAKLRQSQGSPAASPELKPASSAAPRKSASSGHGGDFFDPGARDAPDSYSVNQTAQEESGEAEDFFDLAAELRDELGSDAFPSAPEVPAEEQSLDDIFAEFKKGVEQQADREDSDTHYNLGVAYKEMGLLDDAISEFVMTPETEPKYVQSRHMLGLCYMEKGDYVNAIAELQLAREMAERQERPFSERNGIFYDLGLAYQGSGDNNSALQRFRKVYEIDPDYRNVAEKIKEIQRGGSISMTRLKTDIEKEISSTFLEEGERIQREEKTRKNERIRG